MALTKQDLELIKQTLAPQFEKIDKRFEKIEKQMTKNHKELKEYTDKSINGLKNEFKQDLKKLKAKFK